MRGSLAFFAAALILVGAGGCHRGQVRLALAPGAERHVWRDPIDPQAYGAPARLLLYTAEPPVGYAEARHNPGQTLAIAVRLNWNAVVRPLPQAFEQLCERHNRAEVALSEFTARENELRGALRDLANLKTQLDGLVAEYEAHLPLTDADGANARTVTQALRMQAKQVNERAAARIADLQPPEPAPEVPEAGSEGPVPQ